MRLQRSVALAYAVVCKVVNTLWPEPEPGPGETDEPADQADQAGPVPS